MQDENSIQYLIELKDESRNRYTGKPQKPIKAGEAARTQEKESNTHLLPYDVLMQLYLEASRRITAQGKRPLPYVPEADAMLNEAWRTCLLGWADLEYFKQALSRWESLTGGDSSYQQTMKF